jgi:hypothetical protein
MRPNLRRVEKPEFGFAVHVPVDWPELTPQPNNSGYERARFAYRDERRHNCQVFLSEGSTGLDPRVRAEDARVMLAERDFEHFVFDRTEIAGCPAVRLDFDIARDWGLWSVRQYYVSAGNLIYTLGRTV